MFTKLDCFLTGVLRTIRYFFRTGNLDKIGGCSWVEEEVIENATVHICRCEHCGEYDISWSRGKEL